VDSRPSGAAADDPDDRSLFQAITAPITGEMAQIEQAVTAPPEPATPAPQPAPVRAPSPTPPPRPTPTAPPAPPAPAPVPRAPEAPNYWGEHGLVAVYWIAIVTGAIGQVIFFGQMFELGVPGYLAAGVIATTAETIMVSAGDTALALRAKGRRHRQWVPFLLISITAALAASGMNLTHWWVQNPSMGVLFGGIAFLGFLLHIIHGIGEGTQYLSDKAAYDAAMTGIAEERQREYDAARRAEEKTARENQPAPPPPRPAPAPKSVKQPTKTSTRSQSKAPRLDRDEAVRWSQQHGHPGPSAVRKHFRDRGYEVPAISTLRAWINQRA
jgi:outer membrane biosynthesis protein TonB